MRRVGKPAVEVGKVLESMDMIKDFRQWVMEDFLGVYIEFKRNSFDSFYSKIDVEKYSKMGHSDRCKELLRHFTEIQVYSKHYIRVPCMCCGKDDGNEGNHVIGNANYLKKYLSRNGHVYILKRDFKRNFDGKDVNDPLFWSYENFKWEHRGRQTPDVTFRGFCKDCDNKLFSDIDNGIKDKKDFFKQIYRSACSLYFRFLDQTVKKCYIADVSEDLGLSKNGWSDLMFQSEYGDIDCKPVNTKFVQGQSLYGAYQKYRITKELQAGLDYEKDAVSVASWCVENPSIYCGMVFERQGKGKFERVNSLYRKVDHIYDVVVVLPLKKNETVVLNVTLPLGIEEHMPVAEYLSASERPDIVLTRDIIFGLGTLCDLYMSPQFYESLPPEHLALITDVSKHSDLPAISLFDMDWRRIGRNLWTRK